MKLNTTAWTATLILGLTGAYGCSGDDDKPDGSVIVDSGVTPDSGTTTPDSGVGTPDSGVIPDSGTTEVCMEDSFAPNHVASAATTLNIGDDFPNLQICSGTPDFFKIALTEGQRVSIGVFFQQTQGDLDVDVFAPGDLTTPFAQGASESDNEIVGFQAEAAGEYVISVYGYMDAEAVYQIDVVAGCLVDGECTAPDVCDRQTNSCGEYIEATCGGDGANDPNGSNSQAVALDLTSGSATVTGLNSCQDDIDFFTFDAAAGDSFTVTVTPATTADGFGWYLMDSEGTLYGTADGNIFLSPDAATLPHLAAGTWYLLVLSGVDGEEGYQLSVTKTAGGCTVNSECAASSIGQFCTAGVCGPLEGNGMVALGGLCDDDTDCDANADFCYNASVSPDGFFCNLGCEMDAECTAVGTGAYCAEDRGVCDRPCGGNHDLCFQGGYCADSSNECVFANCNYGAGCDAAGLECLWVPGSTQGACEAPVAPTCGQGGVGEPNDTIATAVALTFTASVATSNGSICDADSDIYSFVVSQPSNVEVAVTWAGMADVDFLVVPSNDTRPAGAGFGIEAQDETSTAMFLAPGTYYVVVGPWEIGETPDMDYNIRVTQSAAACSAMTCLDTSPLRQVCDMSGACVDFDGAGAVAIGGECDDLADCVADADLCFIGQTSVFNHMCSITCGSDAECTAVIAGSQCFDLGNGTGACGMP